MHYFRDKALSIINLLQVSAHVSHCQYSSTSRGTAGSCLAMAQIRRNVCEINYSQLVFSPHKSIACILLVLILRLFTSFKDAITKYDYVNCGMAR